MATQSILKQIVCGISVDYNYWIEMLGNCFEESYNGVGAAFLIVKNIDIAF